ncbi:hypothetical protein OHS71_17920 [Streptomyces sp. NBC_00377]|uniref:hypothetical protein n=1 Tax=unclassified Streptomyces TaxID=2593676 RepID=UPI002E218C5F|nr:MULTISPECIES: hypothetical protein [unclassified Streptomyces]
MDVRASHGPFEAGVLPAAGRTESGYALAAGRPESGYALVAYREPVRQYGPVTAARIMRTVHEGDVPVGRCSPSCAGRVAARRSCGPRWRRARRP